MREASVEGALVSEGKKRWVWCIKSEGLVRGFPDRMLLAPGGRIAFVETKRPGGRDRFAQPIVRRLLEGLGFRYDKIDHTEDVGPFYRDWLDKGDDDSP